MWVLKEIAPEKKQGVKANSNTAHTHILLPWVKEKAPLLVAETDGLPDASLHSDLCLFHCGRGGVEWEDGSIEEGTQMA